MIRITAEFPYGVFHGTHYMADPNHQVAPPLAGLLESAAGAALEEELSNIEVRLQLIDETTDIIEHKLLIEVQIDQSDLHHSLSECARRLRTQINDTLDEFGFFMGGSPCQFPEKYRIHIWAVEAATTDN